MEKMRPVKLMHNYVFGGLPEMPWKVKKTPWQRFVRWVKRLFK